MFQRFWQWLFYITVCKIKWDNTDVQQDFERRSFRAKWITTVTFRKSGCIERRTREELVWMLKVIRENEKRTGWKVPEYKKICKGCGNSDRMAVSDLWFCSRCEMAQ
jgi:hypothetical protein